MWLYILLLWIFFIGAGILLAANLPADISDRRKLQVMEFLLRISNEYLGELIENIFGPNVRNSVLRFWMGLGFVIPLPQPKSITVDDEIMNGVRVRCYKPKKLRSRGAMVYIHGGGWATMKADYYDSLMFVFAKRVGVKVFSIDYRLAPEHPYPAAVDDCLAAVEHLHAKANDYDIDDQKIAVCGDSAGGNLSAVVAQRLKEKKYICCQVLIYPVTSVYSFNLPSYQEYYKKFKGTALLNPKAMARWILMYMGLPSHVENVKKLMKSRHISKELRGTSHFERYLEAEILKKTHGDEDFGRMDDIDLDLAAKFKKGTDPSISPIFGISSDLPPALVLTCGYDVLRDEGKIYAKALQEAGVKTSHLHYSTAFHGILNMPRSPVCNQMTTSIVSYLEKHLVQ